MKLKKEFISHSANGENMMIDVSGKFSGLVKTNSTANYIVELLKHDITEEEIVENMLSKYEVSKETLSQDVKKVIKNLRSIGALDE